MGLRVRIYYGIVVQYPLWLYLFIWVSTSKYQTHSTMASSYKEGSMAIYLWLGLKDLFILLLQKVTHKLGRSMFPTQTEWIHQLAGQPVNMLGTHYKQWCKLWVDDTKIGNSKLKWSPSPQPNTIWGFIGKGVRMCAKEEKSVASLKESLIRL